MRNPEIFRYSSIHDGVESALRVRGKKRCLEEMAFLDTLTGRQLREKASAHPSSDRTYDFYVLDDAQLEAYSVFRHRTTDAKRW